MTPPLNALFQVNASASPTAVLQAQAASYELVFALQGPFLLAIVSLAVLLGRPGMRAMAVMYSSFSLATVCSAFSVVTRLEQGPEVVHDIALSLAMAAVAVTCVFNRRALRALGGEPFSASGVLRPILALSALSVLVVLTFPRLPLTGALGVLFSNATPRPLLLLLMLIAAADAWRAGRRATQGAAAMQLVAVAFGAMVFRQLVGIAASLSAFTGIAIASQSITVIQITTNAINGVALLAALLLEERDAVRAQSERIRTTEMRLARTQRMESLGQMAGGIAHDFANLLTIISGGVSGAQQAEGDTEADEHLLMASEAVDRAANLTRQLSLFARQRPPEIVVFPVAKQVRGMEPMLRRLLGASKTLGIETAGSDGAQVLMDVSQFEQIVLNLVVNARDAMVERGEVRVAVRSMPADAFAPSVFIDRPDAPFDVPLVVIEVQDSGTGIAAENLERIFEPYFSTKGDRGTGLGLATVKSVVRAAGGALGVSSTVGVGTTFHVALPQEGVPAGAL